MGSDRTIPSIWACVTQEDRPFWSSRPPRLRGEGSLEAHVPREGLALRATSKPAGNPPRPLVLTLLLVCPGSEGTPQGEAVKKGKSGNAKSSPEERWWNRLHGQRLQKACNGKGTPDVHGPPLKVAGLRHRRLLLGNQRQLTRQRPKTYSTSRMMAGPPTMHPVWAGTIN